MKAVMYHYVRRHDADLPHFTYLDVDSFERQLDYFSQHHRIASRADFEQSLKTCKPLQNTLVLTFDDGFADHYQYVRPALLARGLWGIFFVSTRPYTEGKLLDVHRTHYLLGRLGGAELLRRIRARLDDSMLQQERADLLRSQTYTRQNNSEAVTEVKRLLNYLIRSDRKEMLLDDLMHEVVTNEAALARGFYLSEEQIREMSQSDLAIGCHAHSHTLLSNLGRERQREEITVSTEILTRLTSGSLFRCFCYPYGGKHSYDENTLEFVAATNYTSGFSVEPRDITEEDLMVHKFELPRYDCNEFLHGRAVVGEPS